MKTQRILDSLILTIGLLLANVSTAFAMPPLPSSFYGTVKLGGVNVPVGTPVSARINGVQYASMNAIMDGADTVYFFDVPGDDCSTAGVIEGGKTGNTVVFYIDGVLADQTAPWQSGTNVALNLTATTNHAPVANAKSVTTAEDTPKAITLTGSDADGDPLTFFIVSGPSHGSLSGTAPNVTYTPAANYHGSDYFTFKVYDGSVYSAPATVCIRVTAATNHAPVANSQTVTTAEDTPKAITLTGSDADGDPLTYSIVSGPSHGWLSGTAPNVTYTPAANYNGTDFFTFKVNDGTVYSAPATICIRVTAATNHAPVANSQTVTTAEDTAKAITLTGSDADGDMLTYFIVSGPSHGSLSGTAPNVTYTPAANYHGSDYFTFKVYDGSVYSAPATVCIRVTAATNHAPVANSQTVTTAEDTPKAITLTGSDADGDPLTYSIVSGPSHGWLSGTAPNVTYTPAANYNGSDSFIFKVNDGTVYSAPATVCIKVTAVNDAPVITEGASINVSMSEDGSPTAFSLALHATDVDSCTLTWSILTAASHGTSSASGTGASKAISYTPTTDYNGTDSFVVQVSDGNGGTDTITVNVTIAAVNDAPVANAQSISTMENTAKAITLTGTDVDFDMLIYSVVAGPSHGTLSGSAPALTYTPAANYNGSDSFTFKANDGALDSNIATVSITVKEFNDAPVCYNVTLTTNEDTTGQIDPSCTDVDGDTLTYSIVAQPRHGVASVVAGKLSYTPAANYNGPDSFTFKANDGIVDSVPATVSITVIAVNDAPVANAQFVSTTEDTAKAITLTGTDVEGSTLTYSIVSGPSHGSLSGTAPALTYTPAANYNGSDSFTFKANDGTVDSAPATVSITVTAVNDAPIANAQSVSTAEDTAKAITLTGSDADGDTLTYSVVAGPSHGILSGTAPNVTYTPAANYNGSDSFTFKVYDGAVYSATATVCITVTAVNDAPVITEGASISVTMSASTPFSLTLHATDVDSGDILTWSIKTQAGHGTASASGTGTSKAITCTPAQHYIGADSFVVQVSDGNGGTDTITVHVTITAVEPTSFTIFLPLILR